ncbi:MAG: trypsin-like peptidase domain-containing protein [Pseudomonadota bacterium]
MKTASIAFWLRSAGFGLLAALAAWGIWQSWQQYMVPAQVSVPSYASAVIRAAPAVVEVRAQRPAERAATDNPLLDELFNDDQEPTPLRTQGSGVIVNENGYIITNNHVIADAVDIKVTLNNFNEYAATVIGTDRETDMAVLKIEADEPLPVIALGDDQLLQVGDIVLAIGNPFGIGQSVTQGIVSALRRQVGGFTAYDQFIQTDAAINPGSSGGALVNLRGELIGLNTSVFDRGDSSQGISFAIPTHLLISIAQQLIEHGTVRRSWLGVAATDWTLGDGQPAPGVLITGIYRNSPAEIAGLRPGDIIRAIDTESTDNVRSLQYLSSRYGPGDTVLLRVARQGSLYDVELVLGERPS